MDLEKVLKERDILYMADQTLRVNIHSGEILEDHRREKYWR